MKPLENLSDQEKEQLLRYLGKIYRRGTQNVRTGWHFGDLAQDKDADMEVAAKIRMILRSMDHDGALILYHDFFEIRAADWWNRKYSACAYAKYRKSAMNQLLSLLYQ